MSLAQPLASSRLVAAKLGERKLDRRIDVAVLPVPYQEGSAAVARGRYLFASRGCADCHGADGAGRVVVEDGKGLLVRAPNIATGASTVAAYQPVDWVRTLRHGIKPSGQIPDAAEKIDHRLAPAEPSPRR